MFAPYFPPDQPHKFANVHKIFGASNITKLLNDLPIHQREDAVNSLAYEAEARVKDPIYGCVGAISILQRQVSQLQAELREAHSDLARYAAPMGQGNVSQPMATSPLAIGMNLAPPPPREQQQILPRDHYLDIARDPSQLREQQLSRDQQLSREQQRDIARVGGGCYETGLVTLGMAGSLGQMGPFPNSRSGNDVSGGHLASPFPHSRSGSDGPGGHLPSPFSNSRQGSDGAGVNMPSPFPNSRHGSDGAGGHLSPFPNSRQGSDGPGGHLSPP